MTEGTTKTPRTDEAITHIPGCGVWEGAHQGQCDCHEHQMVPADFARDLEIKLRTAEQAQKAAEERVRLLTLRLKEAEKDARDNARDAAAEASWKERQGDDYGSY